MDINNIIHGFKCSCGRMHHCNIEYVYIENGAISKLKTLCEKFHNILIIADENTYSAAGEKVEISLSEKNVKKIIFSGKKVLIPDETAIETVEKELICVDLILGIGSGVIQDLCKYISFYSKIPYIIVATAPSMDGYASNSAAMILKGMKETVSAGLPTAIVADIDIIKNAPIEMIKAGYGDIIGKYSALCDWSLSRVVNDEYFCQYIYDTTHKMIENILNKAQSLLTRNEDSIKALTEALIIIGIMMSFAGSSRPASGSEHHLSHFFEIIGIINNEPYFTHGIDVAYSTVITAQIRNKILKSEFPNVLYRLSKEDYINQISKIYKSIADGCIALQEKTGNYSADRISIYNEKEKEIKKILSDTPDAEQIIKMLDLVGFDMKEFYDMYSTEKINNAILYAKDLKDRYTVLWCNYDMFGGYTNG